jgi:hypothetical protein
MRRGEGWGPASNAPPDKSRAFPEAVLPIARLVDLFDFDVRMARTLRAMPAPVRAELVRILELPEAERASAIGDLHRSGIAPNLAELLIDLEEVEGIRAMVRAELLRIERGRPQ